jgi:hypothetical protein
VIFFSFFFSGEKRVIFPLVGKRRERERALREIFLSGLFLAAGRFFFIFSAFFSSQMAIHLTHHLFAHSIAFLAFFACFLTHRRESEREEKREEKRREEKRREERVRYFPHHYNNKIII